MTCEREQHEPVAIVGMGCRWPGGAHNTSRFWEFLCNKENAWKKFESPRFSSDGFHHPNADRPGGFAMKGAFLAKEDARLFDHSFFGMTKLEVETMDPSQRKLLEVSYEAIENAGETWESLSGTRTGVFVGNFCLDHWMIQSRDWDNPRPYAFVGAGTSILANRISYIFNLQGPSLTVDTACSSSMYALHMAVNSIRAGDCESAIVASANWVADPGVQIALDKLGALSASSRCHTFDARAEGYARGEGYGAIYLKRVPLAVADKSPIRAVIRGSAVNSNGRTGGITRPSATGQETVIREAYRHAGGLDYKDTSYFECHGTGTYVGDPIEVAAVGKVFSTTRTQDDPLLVGSVKSNVGHGEGASALASIMKVVLALENEMIPPVFDLQTRNPNIDFTAANVEPVTEMTPWPKDRLLRASINSFGYGGANAHCIIDHVRNVLPDYMAPGIYKSTPKTNGHTNGGTNGHSNGISNGHTNGHINGGTNGDTNRTNGHTNGGTNGHSNGHSNGHQNGQNGDTNGHHNGDSNGHHNGQNGGSNGHLHPNGNSSGRALLESPSLSPALDATTRQLVLLPFSGHNENSIQLNVSVLSNIIDKLPLANVAYTLGSKRSRLAQRSFCIVNKDSVTDNLVVDKKPIRAPLHNSNIGFIFTGQGAQWHGMGRELFQYRVFRRAIEHLDSVLASLPSPPYWSLQNILSGECDENLIQTAELSQVACTALQVGLVDLLASWSVRPSGVAGHSSGEIAAAYASGRITAAESIVAAYFRGQAVAKNKQTGAMLAVGLGPTDVTKYVDDRPDRVKVAAINSPGSVTLSGDTVDIDEISAAMTADGIFNRKLKTGGNAYHSHHMVPIGREYIEMLMKGDALLRNKGLVSPKNRYHKALWSSSVTPSKSTAALQNLSSYWKDNLESPVRFSEAIVHLLNNTEDIPIHAVVEIGPHSALKGPLEQIFKTADKSVPYASALKRFEDAQVSMLQLAGTLFSLNATIDMAAVNAVDKADGVGLVHGHTCVELPTYQYTYNGLNYHESRASKEYRYRSVLRHDLLGSKVVGNAKLRPQWRNILRVKDVPWLKDHRLAPDAVFPGAGYLALAVEAASRIYNEFSGPLQVKGFSLRDVSIKRSLTVPEDDYGMEILTSMELVDVSTAESPSWATFSVSSVERETEKWTEHCTGSIKVEVDSQLTVDDVQARLALPASSRKVNDQTWYKKFLEIGLEYGPGFQTLTNIQADPTSNLASATLNLSSTSLNGGESPYPLHPSSLDGAIQLGLIACYGGSADEANTAYVPVQFPSLYIASNIQDVVGDASLVVCRGERRGIRSATLDFQMIGPNGEVLLNANSLRCMSYSSSTKSEDKSFSSPLTRLVWRPDIRTLNTRQAQQLYPPPKVNVDKSPLWAITNKLAHFVVYSLYESFGKLEDGPKPSGEVGHFFDWIKRKGQHDHSGYIEEARQLANKGLLLQTLDELVSQAPDVEEVKIAKLLHDNMADILYERKTGIDVIIGENLLTPLYKSGLLMTGIYPQLRRVLSGLAHSDPHVRALEIGGGTGGATRIFMDAFTGPNGIKAYQDYTFTDISAGFLSGARESLSEYRDMNFSVFDIEADPEEQGYTLQSYDLIIACQVLHATSNMHKTLSNCRRMLKPGRGKLVLVETTQNFVVPGVVVGTFTGYWAGIPDGRVDAPFQGLSAWDKTLRDAGFSGLDVVLDDFPVPNNTTSVIVSSVPAEIPAPTIISSSSDTVYVLHEGGESVLALVERVSKAITARGLTAKPLTWDNVLNSGDLEPESRVVALLSDNHILSNGSEQDFKVFQHLARNASKLIAVTSCGTIKGQNPDGSVITGLLRVLQNENPGANYTSVDIDTANFALGAEEGEDLADWIANYELVLGQPASFDDSLQGSTQDREFSWQDGCMWVSRHIPDAGFHSKHGLDARSIKPELQTLGIQGPLQATFETPGMLNSLCFKSSKETSQPLPPDFIQVEVSAVGLNSRDLEHWTGRVDGDHLSSEYAGVVTAVGTQVEGLQVGDHVYGLGKGQLGNFVRVPAAFSSKLQPGDDLAQMATLPMAYSTAIYALEHISRLREGQSVLVQSGAKEAGLACIFLAKSTGADVFATVENAEEAEFLQHDLSIPANHIISTFNAVALQRAARVTPRNRFDVIAVTEGIDNWHPVAHVLAPLGHLVNISQTTQGVGLESLPFGVSYSSADLFMVLDSDPLLGKELMQRVDAHFRNGFIRPIKSSTIGVADLASTIGSFSNRIGKLVVSFKDKESKIRIVPSAPTASFDPESYYLITGGLGGVGQSLVRWMGERGAKHLALLSRRAISDVPGAQELVDSLAGRGVIVEGFVCDVSNKDQVLRVVEEISSKRPIKGVVHAAVSYLDLTFDKLSASRWNDGLSAKVQGTRNLHEATLSMPLDFFVMVTSALSLYSFATQGAYTAANNFQDAFARYRRQLGLPASTASFSLIKDTTQVGTNDLTVSLFERNKTLTLGESQFLSLLEPTFLGNKTALDESELEQWSGQSTDPLSAANLHTYLDPLEMMNQKRQEASKESHSMTTQPRWHSDSRVSLIMRAFLDAEKNSADGQPSANENGSQNSPAAIRKEFEAAILKGPEERASTLKLAESAITLVVAEMLFVDVEGIDPARSVADLGVDSLIAAELRNWFVQALGANISMLDLLEPSVSISARAAMITDKLLGGGD